MSFKERVIKKFEQQNEYLSIDTISLRKGLLDLATAIGFFLFASSGLTLMLLLKPLEGFVLLATGVSMEIIGWYHDKIYGTWLKQKGYAK